MEKLLNQYQAKPTDKLATRIRIYNNKHGFAVMFLSAEHQALLSSLI